MTLDCRVNLYVRLVRINIRQYDLLISMFHNIEYNKWCREDFYNYSKVENEIFKRNRLFKLEDVSYFYIWSFWRSSDSVFVKIITNLIVLRGKQNTFYVCYWLTTAIYRIDQSHRRFGLALPSMKLINPIYFCSISVTNLINNNCTTPFTPRFVLTGRIFITAIVSA